MTDNLPAARILLGGTVVHLLELDGVVGAVRDRLTAPAQPARPLAIASANVDHIHHFGSAGQGRVDFEAAGPASPDWLVLLDGVPLVRRAALLTGRDWPLLAGSDLLPLLLGVAESAGATVGFLGGTPTGHELLLAALSEQLPALKISGTWAPPRAQLTDPKGAAELAATVAGTRTELLVVGLGKPRQERWIAEYAQASGARVLLAFGAATDFIAGTVQRAPAWVRKAGVEGAYRLAREPRRLARRYIVQGPPALYRLRKNSRLATESPATTEDK